MKPIQVGLLGIGTVGSGTFNVLRRNQEEIRRRASLLNPAAPHYTRGYGKLFLEHVTQAHLGCDFDFLQSE